MNFYKHHLGDYADATAHLSWDEDMAYTRLLRTYYRTEKPIPVGASIRLCRATTQKQKKAVDSVLLEFFVKDGEIWRNKRADQEIAAYQAQREINQRVGKLGGRPPRNRIETESVTNRNPNQIPDTKNQIPEESKSNTYAAHQKPQRLGAAHKINGDDSPILAKLPLRGGGEFEVRQAWVAELEPIYPDVNVPQTLLEMRGWCLGNPDRAKTRKGIKRFITSWLQNEQEKGDA